MKIRQRISRTLLLIVMGCAGLVLVAGAVIIHFSGSDGVPFVQEEEVALEIQDWMTNDFIWDAGISIVSAVGSNSENEAFNIESWMTDDELWRF